MRKLMTLFATVSVLFVLGFVQTFAAAPSIQARYMTFQDVTDASAKISWINGNGAGRLVVVYTTNTYTDPTNLTNYTADAAYGGAGTVIGSGKVVYKGTAKSVTVTGLTAHQTYYVKVFEFNGADGTSEFKMDAATMNPRSFNTLQTEIGTPAPSVAGNSEGGKVTWADVTGATALGSGYVLDVFDNTLNDFVYRELDLGNPTDPNGFWIMGLAANTTGRYKIRMYAYDANGNIGPWSAWVDFNTTVAPVISILTYTPASGLVAKNGTIVANITTTPTQIGLTGSGTMNGETAVFTEEAIEGNYSLTYTVDCSDDVIADEANLPISVTAWDNASVASNTITNPVNNATAPGVKPYTDATITPTGSTTFCDGGSVLLTANAGSSYLWSNNAITQAITATTAGSYTVTVTYADGCFDVSDATTVTVNPNPTAPTASAVDRNVFCEDDTDNIILTASGGANGTLEWYEDNTGTTYVGSGSPLTIASPTTSKTYYVRRTSTYTPSCGNSAFYATGVSVTVNPQPTATISATAGETDLNLCQGQNVTLTAAPVQSGSIYTYEWFKDDVSQGVASTSANSIIVTVAGAYKVRVANTVTLCVKTSAATTVTVEPTPVAGTLTKSPLAVGVCVGTSVSATLTAGSGGNGTDELEKQTNGGGYTAYTSGATISTVGLTSVDIRTRRMGTNCDPSGYTTVSWTIEATPVNGTLSKAPDQAAVCAGTNVSAALAIGTGGSGDVLQYRTNDGTSWSTWAAYTSGAPISTTGKTGVEISTYRDALYCTSNILTPTTVSWTVNPNPTIALGGSPSVCRGTSPALLPYTATTGGANEYMIDFNGAAETAGFVDVAYTTLPSSPISITIPALAPAATYDGVLYVKNTITGCTSGFYQFTVTVNPVPLTIFTLSSVGQLCDGNSIVFNLSGNEVTLTYRLYKNGVQVGTDYVSAGANASWTINPAGAGSYTAKAWLGNCSLDMDAAPAIVVNPLPDNSLTVAATSPICNGTGTNVTVALSVVGVDYQLRNDADDTNVGASVAGTGGTISLPTGNLTATTTFNVLATNATTTCSVELTQTATVTVYANFTAGSICVNLGSIDKKKNDQLQNGGDCDQTICYNTTATISNAILASGGDGTITYQWESSTTGAFGGEETIISSNTSNLITGNLTTTTTYFRRLAKDNTCNTSWTNSTGVVMITVRPQFNAGAIETTGQTICYGGDPSTIGNTTAATGGNNVITYSWKSSVLGDFTDAVDILSNTDSYDPPSPLNVTTSYRRYAKDGLCNTTPEVSTGTWTVTVRPQFTAGEIESAGETVCYNTTPTTAIGSTTAASGGDGTITYSWRSSVDNYNAAIGGATSATYTPAGPLTATTSYQRYAKDGTCNTTPELSTGTWTVTVRSQFFPGHNMAGGETICYGGNPALIGNSTYASGGNLVYTYQWESSVLGNFTDAVVIPGASSDSYDPPTGLTTTTSYRRSAKDGLCNLTFTLPESTQVWTVTVRPQFTAGAIETTGESVCSGGNPGVIGSVTPASGGGGNISYIWQSSTDDFNLQVTDIEENTPTYDPPTGLTVTTKYRRTALESTCANAEISTGIWTVTVLPLPTPTISGPTVAALNQDITLTTETGKSAYNWTVDGGSITSGQGTATLVVKWATTGTKAVTVNYSNGSCSATSQTFNVNIDNVPPTYSNCGTWNASTQQVVINWSEPVYTNNNGTGDLLITDFVTAFTQNAGTATGASITGITHTAGSSVCTLTVAFVGTATGCEYFKVLPASATSIYDAVGNAAVNASPNITCEFYLPNSTVPTVSTTVATVSAPSITTTSMTLNWTNGSGTHRIIFMKAGSAPTYVPVNNTVYTIGNTYGDSKAVYYGNANTANITGLDPNTTYHFAIYELSNYCNDKMNYKTTSPATTSGTTKTKATKLKIYAINGTPVGVSDVILQGGTTFTVTVRSYDATDLQVAPAATETLTLSTSSPVPASISVSANTTLVNTASEVTFTAVAITNGDNGGSFVLRVDDGVAGDDLTFDTRTIYVRAIEPTSTEQSKMILFSAVDNVSASFNWTAWAISGEGSNPNYGRLLIMRQATSLASDQLPVDGTVYTTDNQNFNASLNVIGTSTPNAKTMYQHVTNSTNSTTITGLTGGLAYHFRLFEYRFTDGVPQSYNYRINGSTLNPRSITLPTKDGVGAGIELANFDAKSYQGIVGLNWATNYESGIAGFELYRINTNTEEDFSLVSSYMNTSNLESANKASSYKTIDNNNLTVGNEYVYKLTAVTFEGTRIDLAEQSVVINTMPNADESLFVEQISPNPVRNQLNINFQIAKSSAVTIQIRDLSGKLIGTVADTKEFNVGKHNMQFNMTGNAAGSYIITVTAGMEAAMQSFIYMP